MAKNFVVTTVYLDYNVISHIAGVPNKANAEDLRKHLLELKTDGYRFALSAWHMYELARSNCQLHVDQCCALVEEILPLWVSNTQSVKRQEVDRYLQPIFDKVGPVRNRNFIPFNETVSLMWKTYSDDLIVHNENFRGSVAALRVDPNDIANIDRAANETPQAILMNRIAHKAGILEDIPYIDRDYLKNLLPSRHSTQQLEYLEKSCMELVKASPTIAVEEALVQLRASDSFKPKPSDGPDMQHALVPLAYCDYFVTDDNRLRNHCNVVTRKLGLKCRVLKSVEDIPI